MSVASKISALPYPVIPRQVSSTTREVPVGREGDIGTLTVSSVPGIGVVAVDMRVATHGSTLAALAEATAAAVTLGLHAGAPARAFRGLDFAGLSLATLEAGIEA